MAWTFPHGFDPATRYDSCRVACLCPVDGASARADIPANFTPNPVTVISDGTSAAMSSVTGSFEHFAPWKTIEGRDVFTAKPALEVLI